MKVDVLFVFGSTSNMDVVEKAHVRRFLREAPHLLMSHSKRDIEYEASQIEVDGLELRCQLNIVPSWPAAARLTDSDMIRMGIPHPIRARATTALLLWIASMHGTDPTTNPLISAWRDFTGDQSATLPISINSYDYHITPPAARHMTSKNDTGAKVNTTSPYDGPTTTRTRVC
jgi:hypothetical protein